VVKNPLGVVFFLSFLLGGASCPGKPPNPIPTPPAPTPTPTPPPTTGAVRTDMLLRQTPQAKLTTLSGTPADFRQAVQCCGFDDPTQPDGWNSKLPGVANHRWPLISSDAIDYFGKYSFNAFHMRMGPFYGDKDHENLWTDTGGPLKADGSPNEAFFAEVDKTIQHAADKGWWVEMNLVDTWYCKHAQWGDQQMPWPQDAIDSCGRTANPTVESYIRFLVARYTRFGNVIWSLDNEGAEIQGAKQAWWDWARDVVRDEEQKDASKHAHLIGATQEFSGAVDFSITHARAPLTAAIDGRWSLNNERNPEFPPEQEASNFKMARDAGLAYAFWRAGMNEQKMTETLELMKGVVDGSTPVGCFPPDENDPLWVTPPASGAVGTSMRPQVDAAKAEMGEKCGRVDGEGSLHGGSLQTLDELGQVLRKNGLCAGRTTDSVFVKTPEGKWQEFHAVSFASGCWANDPTQLPKNTWTYGGQNPTEPEQPPTACQNPGPPAAIDHFNVKEHTKGPNWTTVDSTPIVHDAAYCNSIGSQNLDCPVRLEGDPQRANCEEAVVGTPQWTGCGHVSPDNAYQYLVARNTSCHVEVCTSKQPRVCNGLDVTP